MHKIYDILHKYAARVKKITAQIKAVSQNACSIFCNLMKVLSFMWLLSGAAVAQDVSESLTAERADAQVETATAPIPVPATVKVRMQTTLGPILLLVEKERAPITAANFLRYVDQKRLDGITFYRAVKIGDTGEYGFAQAGVKSDPKRLLKPIAHEPTTVTGLSHVNGAISMARLAPGTATAEFFMVLGDLKAMDANPQASGDNLGYAVFGRIIEGMEVLRTIIDQPRSQTAGVGVMKGQMLEKEIKILTVRRVE